MTDKEQIEFRNGFSFGIDKAKVWLELQTSEAYQNIEKHKDDETFATMFWLGKVEAYEALWKLVDEIEKSGEKTK